MSIPSVPLPRPFTWGKILRVHVVGDDYAIVEYTPRQASNVSDEDYDPSPNFAVFVRGAEPNGGWDTHRSTRSLDRALIIAIAWRVEQARYGRAAAANSSAAEYVMRMLEAYDDLIRQHSAVAARVARAAGRVT